MTDVAGTFEYLLGEMARVFDPLARRVEDETTSSVLEWLGLRSEALGEAEELVNALGTAASAAASLVELIDGLAAAINQEDANEVASISVSMVETIAQVIQAAHTAVDELQDLSGTAGLTPTQQGELTAFAGEFLERLLNHLMVEYIEVRYPQVAVPLLVTGAMEITEVEGGPPESLQGAYTRRAFHFEQMVALFSDPADLLENVYGWGTPGFDGVVLFETLQTLLGLKFQMPSEILQPPGETALLEAFGFNAEVNDALNPPGLDISLRFPGSVSRSETIQTGEWDIAFEIEADFAADLMATVQPLFDIQVNIPSGSADFGVSVSLARSEDADPLLIFGQADGSRLEVQSPGGSVDLELHFEPATGQVPIDPTIHGLLNGGKVVIKGGEGDSFISTLLSSVDIESSFDIELVWSPSTGVYFIGSATLEIAVPAHVSLGPIEIQTIYLQAGLGAGGTIPIELSGAFSAMLGPLQASVDRMGLQADFTFPEGGGNVGPANFELSFKPPRGVGLSVDAGIVKGGGYLYLDPDRGEYAGALELVFSEWIALKAIGLITTKMPDGSEGFSLLIIITVEFGSGIQLGLGFTLLGVGGLLGLNRIVKIDPVKDGIRTGAIESIMFPEDVIANAPKIISDLRKFFPPQQDIFLIGPMGKIGWGTPAIVSVSVGVILEFPSINITILGVIKVVLPDEEADILRLQVNFVGRIEPSNQLLWFYAELYDSRVLFITLEGGFGLLVNWGDNANFVVSAGGFHPRYDPPPLPFPEPPRIAANLLNESYARIRVECYFAVTSNSAQFGARAELLFGLSEFKIEGHLSFDALFQFDPFFFSFSLSVSLSVKVFGVGLFSVGFSGLLEGPTPWHIQGKGKIKVLFFSISVPFEETWGPSQDTKLDPIDVFPLLESEFNALTNWEARIAENSNLLVSLRKFGEEEDSDQLVLHPVGKLRISQRKVPVNYRLDKVGNQRPADVNEIDVEAALLGSPVQVTRVEEKFAIGQFKDLDSANRLSSPAFEPLEGGVEIGVAGEAMKTSQAVRRVIRYETIIIDNNFKEHITSFFEFFATNFAFINTFLFNHFLKGGSAKNSVLSQHQKQRLQPFDEVIQVKPTEYSIVSNTDNRPVDAATTTFTSQAQAAAQMEQMIQTDLGLADRLQVIPNTEVNLEV